MVSTPGTCCGAPRLEGTRITVARLVEAFMGGWSFDQVAEAYGLEVEDVEHAVRWVMRRRRRARWSFVQVAEAYGLEVEDVEHAVRWVMRRRRRARARGS